MTENASTPYPDTAFWRAYLGPAKGLLRWEEVAALWDYLRASGDWFVFDPEGDAPESPLEGAALAKEVAALETLVNSGHDRHCSGAIYVDDKAAPTFIKVFDPRNMGSSCGWGGAPILPYRIISRIQPDPLPPAPEPAKAGFFARLTGAAK